MPALITALPGVSALRTSDTAIPSLNLKHLRVIAKSLIIPSDRLVLTGQNDACTPAEGDLPTQLRRGHNKQHRVLFAVCRMSDTIGIPERVCDMVKDYASRLVDYEDGDRLFDVTKGFLYHEMKRISEQSGVKKIRIHDVRHSHASLLIELGTNILLVSERLGHEDVETTLEIYGHLYPKKDEEVAGRLDRLCA